MRRRAWSGLAVLFIALAPVGPARAEWVDTLNAAHEAFAQADATAAESRYRDALREAEGFGPDDWRVRQTLLHLARFYMTQGRAGDAVPLLERKVGLEERTLGPEHPDLIVSLEVLAQAYELAGDSPAAADARRRAGRIRGDALDDHVPSVVPDATWVSPIGAEREDTHTEHLYERAHDLGAAAGGANTSSATGADTTIPADGTTDPEEAQLLMELAEREATLGPQHPDVAAALRRLGRHYVDQRRFDYAVPAFERALGIRDLTGGADPAPTIAVLEDLAEAEELSGRHAAALDHYTRAFTLAEAHYGANSHELLSYGNGAGRMAVRLGRPKDAETYFRRSADVAARAYGPNNETTLESLRTLARLYTDQRRYADAERVYQDVLGRRERGGADTRRVADALSDLGELYAQTGRFAEAGTAYTRALDLRGDTGENSLATARSLRDIAKLAMNQGRYADAATLYEQALSIQEERLGPNTDMVGITLDDLTRAYTQQHRYSEAATTYQRAVDYWEQRLGPHNLQLAAHFHFLAYLYFIQGRYAEAEPPLARAIAILEEAAGPDHPDVITYLEHQAEVLEGLGQLDRAATVRDRVAALRNSS